MPAALEELATAYPGRLETICGDALEIDARQLGEAPRRIVANLPYNVATPLLIRWLTAVADSPGCLGRMVLMFQKEVAERLAAPAGNRTYGRLSVLAQWLCQVRPLFDIPARAFTPSRR